MLIGVCIKTIYSNIPVTHEIKFPENILYYKGGFNQFIISAYKEEMVFVSARKQTLQV